MGKSILSRKFKKLKLALVDAKVQIVDQFLHFLVLGGLFATAFYFRK
jgi:hypothetical protein